MIYNINRVCFDPALGGDGGCRWKTTMLLCKKSKEENVMLRLCNGVIFPGFIVCLVLYIIIRLMPDSFVRFQKHHTPMSFPIVNFSLPFEVNKDNWPRVKRTGGRIFLFFACVDALNAFCSLQGFYEVLPVSYSRTAGIIFCLCICSFLIGTFLATKSHDSKDEKGNKLPASG